MKNIDGYINRIQTPDGKIYALTCEPLENNKLNIIYDTLKLMDLLLYKYAYEPETVASFRSTEDMAQYFRQFLRVILPEEYRYKKEENCK